MVVYSTWSSIGPLVGVVVGAALAAVLGFGGSFYLDWRRRNEARIAKEERDARELRPAARLVLAELVEIDLGIRHAVAYRSAPIPTSVSRLVLPVLAWREYRASLAARLEPNAWNIVHGAYDMVEEVNWWARLGPMMELFTEEDKSRLRAPWLAVRAAQEALGVLEVSPDEAPGRAAAHRSATAEIEKRHWS